MSRCASQASYATRSWLSHSSSSESAHERKRSEASSGRRPEELALELSSQSETLVRALRACPKCDARRDGQPRSVNYWEVTQRMDRVRRAYLECGLSWREFPIPREWRSMVPGSTQAMTATSLAGAGPGGRPQLFLQVTGVGHPGGPALLKDQLLVLFSAPLNGREFPEKPRF